MILTWFRQWLVACSAPSHCPNQCCRIVDWTHKNKHSSEFIKIQIRKKKHNRKRLWKYHMQNISNFVHALVYWNIRLVLAPTSTATCFYPRNFPESIVYNLNIISTSEKSNYRILYDNEYKHCIKRTWLSCLVSSSQSYIVMQSQIRQWQRNTSCWPPGVSRTQFVKWM